MNFLWSHTGLLGPLSRVLTPQSHGLPLWVQLWPLAKNKDTWCHLVSCYHEDTYTASTRLTHSAESQFREVTSLQPGCLLVSTVVLGPGGGGCGDHPQIKDWPLHILLLSIRSFSSGSFLDRNSCSLLSSPCTFFPFSTASFVRPWGPFCSCQTKCALLFLGSGKVRHVITTCDACCSYFLMRGEGNRAS